MHGPITETHMFFETAGITVRTPMPETAVEFVDGVGVLAVLIHEEPQAGYGILARIAAMLNVMALNGRRSAWVDVGHETVVSFLTFRAKALQDLQDRLALLLIAPG